jgi:hypothetical protein
VPLSRRRRQHRQRLRYRPHVGAVGLTVLAFYWASMTDDGRTGLTVSFGDGTLGQGSPEVLLHARPVRSTF